MADMLKDGIEILAATRAEHASQSVVYTRGAQSDTALVTPTQPLDEFEVAQATGINKRLMSFLVRVADLPGFVNGEPAADDVITYGGTDYLVIPFDGTMAYKRSDAYGIQIRIYAVEDNS